MANGTRRSTGLTTAILTAGTLKSGDVWLTPPMGSGLFTEWQQCSMGVGTDLLSRVGSDWSKRIPFRLFIGSVFCQSIQIWPMREQKRWWKFLEKFFLAP